MADLNVRMARLAELQRQLDIARDALKRAEVLATADDCPRAAGWIDALAGNVSDLSNALPGAMAAALAQAVPVVGLPS